MTIVYVTTGAWGAGTGTPNSAAQVDGNFFDVDQRIVALDADLAEGKRIDTVTYNSSSMTFPLYRWIVANHSAAGRHHAICRVVDEFRALCTRAVVHCGKRLLSDNGKPYDAAGACAPSIQAPPTERPTTTRYINSGCRSEM